MHIFPERAIINSSDNATQTEHIMEKIIAAVEFFFAAIITLATAGSAIIFASILSSSVIILVIVSVLSVVLGGFVLFEKFQESFLTE